MNKLEHSVVKLIEAPVGPILVFCSGANHHRRSGLRTYKSTVELGHRVSIYTVSLGKEEL